MKSLFNCALAFLLIYVALLSKVQGSEAEFSLNKSQIIIADKYADRFCSAKADHFFNGLDNEKTLKYSYFKYIGLQSKEIFTQGMNKILINQIKENCYLADKEEREIKEFFKDAKK